MVMAEMDAALPVLVPLILVRINSLRRGSGHVMAGIHHAIEIARERKDIGELAGVADYRPVNRPGEAAREKRYRASLSC